MQKYFLKKLGIAVSVVSLVMCVFVSRAAETIILTEEIVFYNGQIKLAATLFIPDTKKTSPAIAITHGSSKDSKSHAGFIYLANMLANQGFVVLIYDKRGVGSSGGTYIETPDMSVPAGDLISAVRYLQTRKEVNRDKIGVYGHSQGGWVAPLAAAVCKDISFVMVACGGGISIHEQILYNHRTDMRKQGIGEQAIDSAIQFGRSFYTYLGTEVGYGLVNPLYENAVKQTWFSFYKKLGFGDRMPPPSMLKDPAFNFFKAIRYDPQAALRSLNVNTLAILAEKDEIVPSARAKQLWEDSYYAGGNTDKLTTIILPGEDHYDFERFEGKVRYKQSFENVLVKWLNEKIMIK